MGQNAEACDQQGVCNIQNIVEADGSVYPCDFYALDEYCIGNLNHDSMEEIYQNRLNSDFLEQSRNHSQNCKTCKYFHVCRGGCRRHRQLMGDEYQNVFCEGYQYFFDKNYERLVEISRMCR